MHSYRVHFYFQKSSLIELQKMRYTQNIIATFCPRLKFIRVDSAADGDYSSEGGEPMLWAPETDRMKT